MTALDEICNSISEVEKEDLAIAVLLVHPKDLGILTQHSGYQTLETPLDRPEWEGRQVGTIWNMALIETNSVDPGCPDAIPKAGGVRGLVESLRMTREEVHLRVLPPKKREPNQLQRVITKTRHSLIKLLGGFTDPPHIVG